ncbi:MAG: CAP domain-containing protein [Chloroflexota bacterium]
MKNKTLITFLLLLLLSACISVQVDDAKTPTPSNFITATLAPTKAGFVPATLTSTPAITTTPTLAITAPANCTNSAVLLRDVTIQDNTQVKVGEKFTKTWEFQNTGACPWIGYVLKFAAGDQMNAPLSAPIADTLPKGIVQVSVQLTAPAANGSYTGYFTLNDPSGNEVLIGIEKTFWVKIVVGSGIIIPTTSGVSPTQSTGGGGTANCSYSPNAGFVNQIASLINSERANAGLPALTVNAQLAASAQAHAADMACSNNISHTGSDGSSAYSRVLASGYSGSFSEEIIYGGGGPEAAMSWWMSDQIHRDAILNSSSTEIGVGYAYYSNGGLGDYIAVDFGK